MNEFLARISSQFQEIWRKLSMGQRIWAGALGGVTLALLIGIIVLSQKVVWVKLGDFSPEQAAEVTAELERAGFRQDTQFKVEDDGRSIVVDAKLRNKMIVSLAAKGLMGKSEKGFSIFEEFDITTTDFEQKLRMVEALKSEMRGILRTYSQVEDVRISVPTIENPSPFSDDEIIHTASVVLTLRPGVRLESDQIHAIKNIIAGGFAGLDPQNVTITDQFAKPLFAEDGDDNIANKRTEVISQTERDLEQQIRKALGNVLGNDKITASAKVEFDWDNVEIKIEEFTSPGFDQLKRSEQMEDEKLTGQGIRPGGEPGVASNTPLVYNSIKDFGPIDYARAEKIVNYLANQTTTNRVQSPFVKKMSAAIVIDGTYEVIEDTGGKLSRKYTPRTEEEMRDYKSIIEASLGFSGPRGDQVEVRNRQFNREEQFKAEDEMRSREKFKRQATIYALLAAPFLIALFLLYLAWRRHVRLKEEELSRQRELERQRALAAAEAGLAGEISLEDQERQEIQRRAASLARAKPEVVADLIRTWMSEDAAAT